MLNEILQSRLQKQADTLLSRHRKITATLDDNNSIITNGRLCIDFSSNDYLGLKKHPSVTEAFMRSAKKYGVGSGASVFISGYSDVHAEIEHEFSEWLKVDRTILFNSGYTANLGVISALTNRSNVIFSDKLCHASLLDGILLSRAKHYRYHHFNLEHLQHLAKMHP